MDWLIILLKKTARDELAGWDGVENEQDDFYIYKQDNEVYKKPKARNKEAEKTIA